MVTRVSRKSSLPLRRRKKQNESLLSRADPLRLSTSDSRMPKTISFKPSPEHRDTAPDQFCGSSRRCQVTAGRGQSRNRRKQTNLPNWEAPALSLWVFPDRLANDHAPDRQEALLAWKGCRLSRRQILFLSQTAINLQNDSGRKRFGHFLENVNNPTVSR